VSFIRLINNLNATLKIGLVYLKNPTAAAKAIDFYDNRYRYFSNFRNIISSRELEFHIFFRNMNRRFVEGENCTQSIDNRTSFNWKFSIFLA
jgi:hypothetical protein